MWFTFSATSSVSSVLLVKITMYNCICVMHKYLNILGNTFFTELDTCKINVYWRCELVVKDFDNWPLSRGRMPNRPSHVTSAEQLNLEGQNYCIERARL